MMFPRPDFAPETIRAMQDHAIRCFPQESCGVVIAGAYVPCVNLLADAPDRFRIDPAFYAEHEGAIEAVIHSHPHGPSCPTMADMAAQVATAKNWGIVPFVDGVAKQPIFWGDFRLEEPLLERSFIHGVTDCYSLIRAWFWQNRSVLLPEVPRNPAWWHGAEDLYRESFVKAGFHQIEAKDRQPGDVFIGHVLSRVPNHGGVLLEHGLGLHHLENRLSAREPLGPYINKNITHWVRHA